VENEIDRLQSETERLQSEVRSAAKDLKIEPTKIAGELALLRDGHAAAIKAANDKFAPRIEQLQTIVTKMAIADGHAATLGRLAGDQS